MCEQQHNEKHRHTHQRRLKMNGQNHPKQGCYAFPAAESSENRKQMPNYRNYTQRKLIINELSGGLRTGNRRADEVGQIGCRPSLQDINEHHGCTGFCAQYTESIGCPCIAAPVLPYIHPIERLPQPNGSGNGSEQIGQDYSSNKIDRYHEMQINEKEAKTNTRFFNRPPLPFNSYLVLLPRSEEHTSELHSRENLVCRL